MITSLSVMFLEPTMPFNLSYMRDLSTNKKHHNKLNNKTYIVFELGFVVHYLIFVGFIIIKSSQYKARKTYILDEENF